MVNSPQLAVLAGEGLRLLQGAPPPTPVPQQQAPHPAEHPDLADSRPVNDNEEEYHEDYYEDSQGFGSVIIRMIRKGEFDDEYIDDN